VKCVKHNTEAIGICAYCGRALCESCVGAAPVPRLTCSEACALALARAERTVEEIRERGMQNLRASALYCYLCGGLSASAAVAAWYFLPAPFLVYFAGGCSLVLIVSGLWYDRLGRERGSG